MASYGDSPKADMRPPRSGLCHEVVFSPHAHQAVKQKSESASQLYEFDGDLPGEVRLESGRGIRPVLQEVHLR